MHEIYGKLTKIKIIKNTRQINICPKKLFKNMFKHNVICIKNLPWDVGEPQKMSKIKILWYFLGSQLYCEYTLMCI